MDINFTSSVAEFPPVTSNPVIVAPAAAHQLVIGTQPSSTATVGRPFATQPAVAEEDAYGNVEAGDSTTQVTAMLASGAGPLRGLTSVTLTNGVARFNGLFDNKAETITLDFGGGPLLSLATGPIVVSPASAAKLVVTTPPPASLAAGRPFGMVVTAEDAYGNVATSFDGPVTVAPPGGSPATVQAQGGVATFAGLTVGVSSQGQPIQVSGGGLASASYTPASVVSPAPPTIIGESVAMSRKTNKKGKPAGKATVTGFVLQYSEAMNAATAGASSNYVLDAATVKKVKKKKVTTMAPVGFSASYNPVTNAVTLTLTGKQAFAQGGQITVNYGSGGVTSEDDVALSSSDAEFTIAPKGAGLYGG
jgi:hypothetical protein